MTIVQKQCLLKYLGYYTGEVDGIWGDLSRQATMDLQHAHGLKEDGDFGVKTLEAAKYAVEHDLFKKTELVVAENATTTPSTGTFWDEIEFFARAEFACKCGKCGGFPVEPDDKLVRTVDEIRRRLGVPISINSGIRCPVHNANVGGVSNSEHLGGNAADLHSKKSPEEMKAVAEAVMGNTGGIGLYSWGIHVDVGKYSRWNG